MSVLCIEEGKKLFSCLDMKLKLLRPPDENENSHGKHRLTFMMVSSAIIIEGSHRLQNFEKAS